MKKTIAALFVSVFVLWTLLAWSHNWGPAGYLSCREEMLAAATLVESCHQTLWGYRERTGLATDTTVDVNKTGVIGSSYSIITTTIGNRESKRTSANPDFAALLVNWFCQLGLEPGDGVAIGASGSFPGLIISTLAACQVLGLEPLLLVSLGSSTWGANEPEFTWLDMEKVLRDEGIWQWQSLAAFYGGNEDRATDLSEQGRKAIESAALRNNVPLVNVSTLEESINYRLSVYQDAAVPIKVFVNIGGASANTGDYFSTRQFDPGINMPSAEATLHGTGVMVAMINQGVPVINLLDIRSLALSHGIVIDASPFPQSGDSPLYRGGAPNLWLLLTALLWALGCGKFLARELRASDKKG